MIRLMAVQHGCARRDQLVALGLNPRAIQHRLDRGLLTRVHPTVYQLGQAPLGREAAWMAAVLYGGRRAALSRGAAAAAWGIIRRAPSVIDVVHPGNRAGCSDAVSIWRSRTLSRSDVTTLRGIPVTTVTRTIVDLADQMTPYRLVNVMHEAQYLRRWSPAQLERRRARDRNRRGAGTLRLATELLRAGSRGTVSSLEDLVVTAALDAVDERPLVNADVPVLGGAVMVDICWPSIRLCIEVDGPVHQLARKRKTDAARDAALRAAGYRVRRLGHHRIEQLGHAGLVEWITAAVEARGGGR